MKALGVTSAHGYTVAEAEYSATLALGLVGKDDKVLPVGGCVFASREEGEAFIQRLEDTIEKAPVISSNAWAAAGRAAQKHGAPIWVLEGTAEGFAGKLGFRPAHLIPGFNGDRIAPPPTGWEILATIVGGPVEDWRGGPHSGRLCPIHFKREVK
jgi:hypothetical protein